MNYKLVIEQQLAIDYNCTLEEVQGNENIIKPMKRNVGARPIGEDDCMFKAVCYGGKLLIMADEKILDWCREKLLRRDAAWVSEPQVLCGINEKLREFGHCLADVHHYYLPVGESEIEERFPIKCFEGDEIMQFEEDERFGEALLFEEDTPDMIAVCAMEGEEILGMAGATADSENMWQLGVNVTEAGKGKGVGTYVVSVLKNKVLEKGKVPFYGTVESHIKSQKVAIQAGFIPVFLEMFSEKY